MTNIDRRGVLRRWAEDLALGVRLAVGGGRTPWGRISLTAIGAGMGVAVLLLLASAGTVAEQRALRESARTPDRVDEQRGEVVDPDTGFHFYQNYVDHGDTRFRALFVDLDGSSPQPPPGVDTLPAPGEILASPALAELLRSPEGAGLRQRLGDEVVGVIGPDGLLDPQEHLAYVGSDQLRDRGDLAVHGFNIDGRFHQDEITPIVLTMLLVGVAVMVVPVVVFTANSTRMAEAARDRRLAALRLVGADARQVRRIAAGEALLGAVGGLVVGFLAFFPARQFLEQLSIMQVGVYASDVVPAWWAVIAIVVGLPAVAVGSAVVAMRRTVVEPLGVVRGSRAVRRRLGWRLVPIIVGGIGMVAATPEAAVRSTGTAMVFSLSVALLLIGVPALLPWLLERAVARLRGGPLPWQFAVRRLQLDPGTAARAVSGVAVVLAGMIGLQVIVSTLRAEVRDEAAARAAIAAADEYSNSSEPQEVGRFSVYSSRADNDESVRRELIAALEAEPAVDDVFVGWKTYLARLGDEYHEAHHVAVGDCEQLAKLNTLPDCEPGDVFVLTNPDDHHEATEAGARLQLRYDDPAVDFTIPADARTIPSDPQPFAWTHSETYSVLLTREAAAGLPARQLEEQLTVAVDPNDRDAVEAALIALSDVDPLVQFGGLESALSPQGDDQEEQRLFDTVLLALTIAGVLTFALIGSSLLVVAVEQIGERRRPLAVISAVGAPRRTLAFSVLLQSMIPMAAGLVTALGIGMLMALLTLLPGWRIPHFALAEIGWTVLAGLLVTFVVTLGTLPALRRATRPEELRTE
ncbi:cell division protein FtsX [Actinoalloteichus hoggarensis]|uniref:FtsX-like permease family protein n=1 Tax=Actinoalloteichus hoggarensis TaxID=1470176 RepID=A0A221WB01_9PSEU|nr:FtsX-like permease family protein [Actinoalloteichus hoggarensis]ASO22881.1 FtsX-like permease family protein [Actinoalloteichus hoggarensis]MBB5923977.1 cell division protein FtsX [Actinoalloteichus hoggarensis]